MSSSDALVNDVIEIVVTTLGIEERASTVDADTELLDSMPELTSLAIVQLLIALEDRFDIDYADDEVTGDVFETVASLSAFVDDHRPS